ncbi:MAG: efflux RND transporter periplasmic adaptor subunit [Candidatus Eremiobacteraeota bacterium]|nr:efflux RND transporter periplasmic adaptor subunit [Candidatus Eremiobacteraeota bacterium]
MKKSYLILILLLLGGCAKEQAKQAPAPPPPPEVTVEAARREDVSVFDSYTSELKANEVAEVRARVEGTLLDYSFREGSLVQQGQVLFQLDPEPYQAALSAARGQLSQAEGRLAQAQGSLAQAKAELERARTQVNMQQVTAEVARSKSAWDAAQREVDRYQALVDQGAVPKQRYDQAVDTRDLARADYEAVRARLQNTKVGDQADVGVAKANVESAQAGVVSAQAAIKSARAEVEKAQLNLSYTTIRAPFTGIIGTLGVDPGSLVMPGQTRLATLSNSDPIYADFAISEAEYLRLSRNQGFDGSPFHLELADGSKYDEAGRFVLVDRSLNQGTGTITVRAKFSNPDLLLRPGGFGRVTMLKEKVPSAIVIPQKALTNIQSLDAVFVVKPDNTVEQRQIELGARLQDGIVVEKGLEPGERVVVDGLQKVRPGMAVQVL